MGTWKKSVCVLAVLAGVLALPKAARAQSAIAGVVKDASGAVLPGVTVEAASPALIGKSRAVVTDGEGQYKIVDLRPGTYSVTFSLEGFSTIVRDGIELPANFTAPVSVELKVGSLSETIMVSGETPIVDVQSALVQNVISKALLDAIPTARNFQGVAITSPAVQSSAPDVGGSQGMFYTRLTVYGSLRNEQAIQIDGIAATCGEGDGTVEGMYRDYADNEEVVFQTTAIPAEVSQGGVRINMIGREGGNLFKGSFFGAQSLGKLQSNNFNDELKAKGLRTPTTTDRIFDVNLTFGGPLRRDKVWFFTSARVFGVNLVPADTFNPDGSKAIDDGIQNNIGVRLTYQANTKNKLSLYLAQQPTRRLSHRGLGGGTQPSGSYVQNVYSSYNAIGRWSWTAGDKLIVESGFSAVRYGWTASNQPGFENSIAKQDLILGTKWDGQDRTWDSTNATKNVVGAVTYVTGSHALKTGFQYVHVMVDGKRSLPGDLVQQYRTGVPASVVVYSTPVISQQSLSPNLGLYVQDSWTINRLTLSPGLRYEWFNPVIAEGGAPAGRFVPARRFAATSLPNFKDFTPRLGAAFDLFGNRKTAVKATIAKYMQGDAVSFASTYNPMAQTTDQRTWTDLNRDNVAQDNEIGPSNNANFGVVAARSPDPNIKRPYHMEYSASVQHQLMPRISITAGYFHRSYHNLTSSKNMAVSFSDYTPISIANPMGGDPITIYNLNPAKRSAVNIVDSTSSDMKRLYNGVELTFTARFARGASLFGGMNIGKIAQVSCDVSDPNLLRFCDQRSYMPYLTQFKLTGNYPLPAGFQLSGVFQGLAGIPVDTSQTSGGLLEGGIVPAYLVNRTIVPTLTQTQISVPLTPPGTTYLERQKQLDLRIARRFRVGNVSIDPSLDIFNALNASTVINANQTWGSAYMRPLQILQGRLLRLSLQMNF